VEEDMKARLLFGVLLLVTALGVGSTHAVALPKSERTSATLHLQFWWSYEPSPSEGFWYLNDDHTFTDQTGSHGRWRYDAESNDFELSYEHVVTYSGSYLGGRLVGTMQGPGISGKWRAQRVAVPPE
jgi:hypothetical protein